MRQITIMVVVLSGAIALAQAPSLQQCRNNFISACSTQVHMDMAMAQTARGGSAAKLPGTSPEQYCRCIAMTFNVQEFVESDGKYSNRLIRSIFETVGDQIDESCGRYKPY